MEAYLYLTIGLIGGYLLGSVPFGLVLTKLARTPDIRTIGSGNIGATNVLRTGRKDLALLTLICDSGKGAAAVYLISIFVTPFAAFGAVLGSVIGHMYPVWLGFKGGKGVATTIGVFLIFTPVPGLLMCATWLVTALITRISSLSALIMMVLAPVYVLVLCTPTHAVITLTVSAMVIYKHKDNIQRLRNGTESKIGDKKK